MKVTSIQGLTNWDPQIEVRLLGSSRRRSTLPTGSLPSWPFLERSGAHGKGSKVGAHNRTSLVATSNELKRGDLKAHAIPTLSSIEFSCHPTLHAHGPSLLEKEMLLLSTLLLHMSSRPKPWSKLHMRVKVSITASSRTYPARNLTTKVTENNRASQESTVKLHVSKLPSNPRIVTEEPFVQKRGLPNHPLKLSCRPYLPLDLYGVSFKWLKKLLTCIKVHTWNMRKQLQEKNVALNQPAQACITFTAATLWSSLRFEVEVVDMEGYYLKWSYRYPSTHSMTRKKEPRHF